MSVHTAYYVSRSIPAVVLAAKDLRYVGPIPGMDPARRSIVEADLVKLAACQFDDQGVLKVTPIGDEVRLLVCRHVEYGYDVSNVLPIDYIPSLAHSIIAVCGRRGRGLTGIHGRAPHGSGGAG